MDSATQPVGDSQLLSQCTPAISVTPPWGFLISMETGESIPLIQDHITMGRNNTCTIAIPDERISGLHCTLSRQVFHSPSHSDFNSSNSTAANHMVAGDGGGDGCTLSVITLEDNSMNGTYIDGRRIGKGRSDRLTSGDLCLVRITTKRSRDDHSSRGAAVHNYVRRYMVHIQRNQSMSRQSQASSMSRRSTQPTLSIGPNSGAFPSVPHYHNDSTSLHSLVPSSHGRGISSPSPRQLARRKSANDEVVSWQLGERIGAGAFAEVFIGLETRSGRMIAVKRLKRRCTDDEGPASFPPRRSMFEEGSSGASSLIGGGFVLQTSLGGYDDIDECPTDTFDSRQDLLMGRRIEEGKGEAESALRLLGPSELDELEVLKTLSHPHVVKYYGYAVQHGHFSFLLEFVSGGSLQSLISKFGRLEENLVRIYTLQVLSGLEYLHDAGVIHGDIKPANILVNDQGKVKLSDFGTSRILQNRMRRVGSGDGSGDAEKSSDDPGMNGVMRTGGGLCGSPLYMSPEMIMTESNSFKSDVWALGGMVLEMVTGKPPWSEKNFVASAVQVVIYNIGTCKTGPGLDLARDMGASPLLIAFLQRCFTIDANLRPTVFELLQDPFFAPSNVGARQQQLGGLAEKSSSGALLPTVAPMQAPNPPRAVEQSPSNTSNGSPLNLDATSVEGGRPSHQLLDHLSFLRERSFDIQSRSQTPAQTPISLRGGAGREDTGVSIGRGTAMLLPPTTSSTDPTGGTVAPLKRAGAKRLAVTSRRRVEGDGMRLTSGITAEFQDGLSLRADDVDVEEENSSRCEGQK